MMLFEKNHLAALFTAVAAACDVAAYPTVDVSALHAVKCP